MCTAGDAIFLKKHSYIAYICEIIRWSRLELSERQWYSYTSFAIYTRKRDDLNNFHRFLHLNQVLLECIKPLNTQHIKLQVVSQQFYVSYQRDVTILKNSSPLLGCKTLQYCLKKISILNFLLIRHSSSLSTSFSSGLQYALECQWRGWWCSGLQDTWNPV